MDSALTPLLGLSIDSPWFVNVAAEPLLQLLELHPHLNVTTLALSPPSNPFRVERNHLEKRGSCFDIVNGNGTPNTTSSSPSGALIGGIVGGVVGGLLLLILAWVLWRRSSKKRKQKQPPPFTIDTNNAATQPPMPTPYDHQGMNAGTPPLMKQTGIVGMGPGPNYTPTGYPAPPSTSGGWSSSNNTNAGSAAGLVHGGTGAGGPNAQDRQSYYNYAPPPADSMPGQYNMPSPSGYYPSPTTDASSSTQWNHPNNNNMLAVGGTGYSGTPSPPPPSVTPGGSSIQGYAPWAIPHTSSPGPGSSSTAGASSSAGSPPPHLPPGAQAALLSAAEEKAHYSGGKYPGGPGDDKGRPARMSVQTPAPPAYSAYTGPPPQ